MAKRRISSINTAPLRRIEPDHHWRSLRQGDRVNITLMPGYESSGVVDAVTGDATAVWVELDGGRGRTLVHVSDGVAIVPQPTTAAVPQES
ncbi:hypothetical protein J2790_003418 [Paenarthrobacter nicotinovorans]|uniref:KOW domain-containing protein n=1 Tax=Paenarthrobacter nicotinovorans TaxID=29320 RepID=A0ABV0GQR0_PAENI|nr:MULTISPECIES: hypothetical protein [Micrococcaceae]MDR6438257.1 hypothetical protein [Paenarthrobacter nicotinovorans]BCW56717.1 hypothetical protein StoSoilB20_00640 [Arthrobacter sp. StoSoilB20]SCZ52759.1 hypothetical protein SAMN02799638_01035 [Arthrobacter sp. UNCCL28]